MKIYNVSTLGAAILFSILCMGMLGLFVILPVICIQWTWNAIVPTLSAFPQINLWQSGLLYLAGATCLYLAGFVRIDFENSPQAKP